ncbi:unnamed protein product [Rodentolepis nana]|uniref:Homeobox domain-containing protein n=1 Tax=Rodentolepis nana TaxID=102285 RepID=A0A0R3TE08_RODNA|nr:unnamed protein product [Rodentolepis nana]
MPGGPESFLIENILRKSDDTNERSTMDISALESFNDVACNPHKPPSDKEHTKDNSSSNSGSTNLSPPQPGSYRSESSEESPALKFSTESIMMSSPDIKRNRDYLFPIDESVSPPNQLTFPWLHLPPVLSGFYQGGLTATPSAHFPTLVTRKKDESIKITQYSSFEFEHALLEENRPKRVRITFSSYQVKVLRAIYYQRKYLSRTERSKLSGMLGVSEQQAIRYLQLMLLFLQYESGTPERRIELKIWFQNQRYKEKRGIEVEKENAYFSTNNSSHVQMDPLLSQLAPPYSSHSGFANKLREILRFPLPPTLPPPPPLLSQMKSAPHRCLAQTASMSLHTLTP